MNGTDAVPEFALKALANPIANPKKSGFVNIG